MGKATNQAIATGIETILEVVGKSSKKVDVPIEVPKKKALNATVENQTPVVEGTAEYLSKQSDLQIPENYYDNYPVKDLNDFESSYGQPITGTYREVPDLDAEAKRLQNKWLEFDQNKLNEEDLLYRTEPDIDIPLQERGITPSIPEHLHFIPSEFDLDNQRLWELLDKQEQILSKRTKGGRYHNNLTSTPPWEIENLVYNTNIKMRDNPYAVIEKAAEDGGEHIYKKMHHKSMVAVTAPHFNRARELVKQNKATDIDIINLHFAAESIMPAGGGFDAIYQMFDITHTQLHRTAQKLGIQPSHVGGKAGKQGPGYLSDIKKIERDVSKMDIAELTASFVETLESIAVPMQREAELLELAFSKVHPKEIDSLTREQLQALRESLGKNLDEWGRPDPESWGTLEGLEEAALEKRQRQLGGS